MSRLIRVELKNIFSKFDIKSTLLIFTIFGIVIGITNKANNSLTCEGIFEWGLVLMLLISALGGLYISRDYTQNTIRNKIIVGHTRFSIYLSKQIAITSMYLVCSGLFMISTIVSNFIFIGTENLNKEALWIGLLVSIFVAITFSSITTFIAMSIKKETGGLMPLLVMFIMMMFSAMGTEFIDGKAIEIINDVVPTSQMMLLNLMNVDSHPIRHVLYSLLTSVMFFISGYAIFKKSDLN
jgi:hypothetical protein